MRRCRVNARLFSSSVQCIRSVPMFFAKRLYKSMKVNDSTRNTQRAKREEI